MGGFIDWVQQNWEMIPVVITSVIGTASIIVKLTPTPKDDAILASIVKFLSKYIALNKNTPS